MVISEFFASIGFKVDTKGADQFTAYLNNIETKMRAVRASAVKLNRSLQNATQVKTKLNSIGSVRSTSSAAKQITSLNNATTSGASKITTYTGKLHNLAVALDRVATSASKVNLPQGNLRFTNAMASGVTRQNRGSNAASNGMMAGFAGMIGGPFARAFLGLSGASIAAAGIIKAVRTGRSVVASELAIRGGSNTRQLGSDNIKFARQTAQELGLPLTDALEQFGKIVGSSVGSGIDNNTVQNIFKGITEFGVSRQIDPERMQLSLRAVGQMMSKQKVSAEELKGQFAEHLPGALGIAAKSLGTSVPEMFKMMENGELFAKDLLPKMANEMALAARANGALESALKTSLAAQNRFNASITNFSTIVYKAVDPALARMFNFFSDTINLINEKIGGAESNGFETTAQMNPVVLAIGGIFKSLWQIIVTVVTKDIPAIGSFFGIVGNSLYLSLQAIGTVLKEAVLWIDDILMYIADPNSLTATGEFMDNLQAFLTSQETLDKLKAIATSWLDSLVDGFIESMRISIPDAWNFAKFFATGQLPDRSGASNMAAKVATVAENTAPYFGNAGGMGIPAWNSTVNIVINGNADKDTVSKMADTVPVMLRPPAIPK